MNKIPIIIAGSGRSGTTWILDVIAKSNNLRAIFEPLNPIQIYEARPFANRYVKDEANEPELKLFMDEIFKGKFKSLWTDYRIRKDLLKDDLRRLGFYKYLFVQFLRHNKLRFSNLIIKFGSSPNY